MGVPISHPDKIFWPEAGDGRPVTKLELARYFARVGRWMMPHINGRPCAILRAPDGIKGGKFFQRHTMPGQPESIEKLRISGKAYLQIHRLSALAALAQLGALELHPGNCVKGHIEEPGRLVFDLDPSPGAGFAGCVAAARELKKRLEKLGLVPFVRTSGGKGIHVVTPVRAKGLGWRDAKATARAICAGMAADHPDKYVVNMAKSKRRGRIFLDYLRNDRMATAVAPLSPRAQAGAPVAMPLNWKQLREGLDPKSFTIRTAPAMLARSGAWRGYGGAAKSLRGVMKKLGLPPRDLTRIKEGRRPARKTGRSQGGKRHA